MSNANTPNQNLLANAFNAPFIINNGAKNVFVAEQISGGFGFQIGNYQDGTGADDHWYVTLNKNNILLASQAVNAIIQNASGSGVSALNVSATEISFTDGTNSFTHSVSTGITTITGPVAAGLVISGGGSYVNLSDAENGGYKVGGTKVVGAQQNSIAHAAGGGDEVPRINDIIDTLRAHGLIASP